MCRVNSEPDTIVIIIMLYMCLVDFVYFFVYKFWGWENCFKIFLPGGIFCAFWRKPEGALTVRVWKMKGRTTRGGQVASTKHDEQRPPSDRMTGGAPTLPWRFGEKGGRLHLGALGKNGFPLDKLNFIIHANFINTNKIWFIPDGAVNIIPVIGIVWLDVSVMSTNNSYNMDYVEIFHSGAPVILVLRDGFFALLVFY